MAWQFEFRDGSGVMHKACYATVEEFAIVRPQQHVRAVFALYHDASAYESAFRPLPEKVSIVIGPEPQEIVPAVTDGDGKEITPAVLLPGFAQAMALAADPSKGTLYPAMATAIYQISARLPVFAAAVMA